MAERTSLLALTVVVTTVVLVVSLGGCAKTAVQGRADLAATADLTGGGGGEDMSQPVVLDMTPVLPDYAGLDVKGLDLFLVLPDLTAPPADFTGLVVDLKPPPADLIVVQGCAPDPMIDGQADCGACPMGTIGVNDYQSTLCHCWTACNPSSMPSTCVCG